jgi:hypothetical protein
MATTSTKKRAIKYLNRDFESFKKDLTEHLRIYFPDTIQDFNESSVGMMLTELVSFIGDNMSFYLDKRFNETFVETATEQKNIFRHAKQLGFKPSGKAAATGLVDTYLVVPASSSAEEIIPDMRYAGTIKKGAKLKSASGELYETLIDSDFGNVNPRDVNFAQVADRDTDGNPTTFALKNPDIDVKAGETKTATFSVGTYKAFRKIVIPEDDVLEVLEVKDSEGNEYFEVDFLAQDTIFDGVPNTGDDATEVPYTLKLRSVPFRFVTEYDIDANRMSLVFGTGDADSFDGELIPDLGDLSLPLFGKDTFTDFFLDPQNFLKTRTLGIAPVSTTLTVKYRVGGGTATNAGAGEVNTVDSSTFDVGDSTLSATTAQDVGNSFSVNNPSPIQGGRDELNTEEIRALISAHHATQGRMVNTQDFVARALSMPSRFGSVFRANARVSALNKNAVELIALSRNSSGQVTIAPTDLKTNLKRYLARFRMLTDAIEILDGEIINIAVNFEVLTNPDFNKSDVVVNCIETLKDFFDVEVWQINQPINLTDIFVKLAEVSGVMSVTKVEISNRVGNFGETGRAYSSTGHNIRENTNNGIIYSKENAIFEVKYPNKDIVGVAK